MISTSVEDHVGSKKAQLIDLLNRSAKFEDDDVRTAEEIRLASTIDLLDKMQAKTVLIRMNPNLSEKGMAEQLRQLAKETLKELSGLFEDADRADKQYIAANAQILAVPEAAEGRSELATLMREQELRLWLRTLPLYAALFVYLAAAKNNDVELIRAVRTAPGPALVPADFIERCSKENTEQDRLVRLESLDILRRELRDVCQMLKVWLEGYEPVTFPTPPIKQGSSSMAAR